MIKRSLTFIALFTLNSSCTIAQLKSARTTPKIDHHTIRVKIDHTKSTLSGDVEIRYKGASGSNRFETIFSFLDGKIKNIFIDGIVTQNYTYENHPTLTPELSKQYDFKLLKISIPKAIAQKPSFSLRIVYEDHKFYGTATNPEDQKPFSLGQISKTNAFSSHINYYPYIQYAGNSADIYLSTNLKDAFAITSGKLISETSQGNGFTEFHYRTQHMSGIIPYPFAIAKYKRLEKTVGKTKLQVVYHPKDEKYAKEKLPVMENIFKTYESIFGPYPFDSLSVVETQLKKGNIGLAAQSVVMISDKVWFAAPLNPTDARLTNRPLLVLADEINHQWNAYKVNTPNYLAEGISRYVDSLYMESIGDSSTLQEHMTLTKGSYFYLINKGGIEDKPITDPTVYPALYFIKGASALHMLRKMYGYDNLKKALRDYFTKYEGKVTSLDQFRGSFEDVVDEDLKWFFAQWYHRKGWPKLKFTWKTKETHKVAIEIVQSQAETFRLDKFPIKLVYSDNSVKETHINITAAKSQTIELPAKKKIKQIHFDPEEWFLVEIK